MADGDIRAFASVRARRTARPIPESPPVMSATLSTSLPAARYSLGLVPRQRLELRFQPWLGLMLFRKGWRRFRMPRIDGRLLSFFGRALHEPA